MGLLQIISKSWYIMVPLLLISLVLLAMILERLIFFAREKVDGEMFLEGLFTRLNDGKTDRGREYCRQANHALSRLAAFALDHTAGDLSEAMSHQARREMKAILRFSTSLGTIARVAPLIGLLGTVTGMIQAFAAIAKTTEAMNQAVLAVHISEALITTASGLIIAIPAIIFSNAFANKANRLIDSLERMVEHLPAKLGR